MKKRIYLSGFSLGGNVVLKLLGELGVEASTFNVAVACDAGYSGSPVVAACGLAGDYTLSNPCTGMMHMGIGSCVHTVK